MLGLGARAAIEHVFAGPGAAVLLWEAASRCSCYSEDSRQPTWGHDECGGLGALFAAGVAVRALFRGQSRWVAPEMSGEHGLGEAQLTSACFDLELDGTRYPACKPSFIDHRVRDRFTVVAAAGDVEVGRVFYPAAQPVPFLFAGAQHAWRTQLQGLDQATRLRAQP